ncbi:MAG: phytanoyl-CoA dioxygenase family protein [Chloracidobacterium sp.]|nr:phytanoyl-CoA dioxygenase family protein [Chloracidobacterium sp.]
MFSESGFEIFDDVLTEAECDSFIEHLCKDEFRAGRRHLMNDRRVNELARDARLNSIIGRINGEPLIPFKATLFQKTGKANWLVSWHQDTALPVQSAPDAEGWGPATEKEGVTFAHAPTAALAKVIAVRIHLDASTELNGPLRVIPGSHQKRISDDAEFLRWTHRRSVECHVTKGGVLAMSPLLIHASSKSKSEAQRRVIHIEYAPDLEIAARIRLAFA